MRWFVASGVSLKQSKRVGRRDGATTTTPFRPNDNGKFYADMEVQSYPISVAFYLSDMKLACDMSSNDFEFTIQLTQVE
jgi:hypothetical protein